MQLIVYICVFLSLTLNVVAQKDTTSVEVAIRLLDADSNRPIRNAQIISYISQHGFVTGRDGLLIQTFPLSDSLRVFDLGYEAKTLHARDFVDVGIDSIVDVILSRHSYMIRAINIGGDKLHLHMPKDIKMGKNKDLPPPPLRSNDFGGEKPTVTAAIFSPLSFIHYYMSKDEKKKRKFRAELAKNNEQLKVDVFYNSTIIRKISGYKTDSLNNFIVYCNTHLKIDSKTNPIDAQQMILDAKTEFENKKDK